MSERGPDFRLSPRKGSSMFSSQLPSPTSSTDQSAHR
eukprot:CAMPEP_0205940364 /NCGR_PEP_ID=MMETSP1325-20131115/52193_1 /ASSEMBLY_ACC=CAM_ASM_000708 /TAXON_ID=236786 /ORGANISM="Florenciella sp., Strain RCC1007" /LENGTH=36 /DNA_ID= /DNA_START= /DNA_END= /DNA_ORIENTATION=